MGQAAERLEWLEARKQYIGGTDAAAIVGLSRRKTLLDCWAEKTGTVPIDDKDSEPAKVGRYLEAYVSQRFTEETGKKVRRVNDTLFHKEFPFIGANIDRRVIGEDAILEAKTTTAWLAKEWETNEIPQEYIVQCLHYLAVTGALRCYLAVLIGNQEFKWMVVERDEAAIASLVRREVEFWTQYVIPRRMPKLVKAADSDILSRLFNEAPEGSLISLPNEANDKIDLIEAYSADKRNLEAQIGQMKNELKMMLGNNEAGLTDRYKVTWRFQKDKTTRVLRIAERKGA